MNIIGTLLVLALLIFGAGEFALKLFGEGASAAYFASALFLVALLFLAKIDRGEDPDQEKKGVDHQGRDKHVTKSGGSDSFQVRAGRNLFSTRSCQVNSSFSSTSTAREGFERRDNEGTTIKRAEGAKVHQRESEVRLQKTLTRDASRTRAAVVETFRELMVREKRAKGIRRALFKLLMIFIAGSGLVFFALKLID